MADYERGETNGRQRIVAHDEIGSRSVSIPSSINRQGFGEAHAAHARPNGVRRLVTMHGALIFAPFECDSGALTVHSAGSVGP